jgi:exopolyphosphatase/guanosine-5'-triphosphate,3'-diphosphate pyrophosphatase
MRSAVVDLGSCTFHALVADVDRVGIRRAVYDRKRHVRLGSMLVDGVLPEVAAADAIDVAVELIEKVRRRTPERVRVVASGVFREAANAHELLAKIARKANVEPELLDGAREAELTWLGVSSELAGSHGRLAVIDLGGASLEYAIGSSGVEAAYSAPIGALRLRGQSVATIRSHMAAFCEPIISDVQLDGIDTLALSSGTARALLAVARRLGLTSDLQRYVGTRAFAELARRLAPLSTEAIQALGVGVNRADTIGAGAVALAKVLDLLDKPVVYVARHALREGALIDLELSRRSRPSLSFAAAQ